MLGVECVTYKSLSKVCVWEITRSHTEGMRPVVIMIAVFALLTFDLVNNNGEWFGIVTSFADDIVREIRHTLLG